nr:Hpt domain-containing protein [Roseivirga sp. E12]
MLNLDLTNLERITRGNQSSLLKYLRQFKELIPERVSQLRQMIKEKDRKGIRQCLHKMSPQLEFFGVNDAVVLKHRLELEYDSFPQEEMEAMLEQLLDKIDQSYLEIDKVIAKHV